MEKKRLMHSMIFGIVLIIFCLNSFLKLRSFPSFPYPWLRWYHSIFHISILISGIVFVSSTILFKSRFIGLTVAVVGIMMLILSLSSTFLGASIFGITMLIFSLFFIFWGSTFLPSKGISICGVIMFLFSLFSILFGMTFFPSSWLEFHYRIVKFLILISGLVYGAGSIFIFINRFSIFRLKKGARKLTIYCSIILSIYFVPYLIFLFVYPDPSGWGKVMALSFSPWIIFPLFFIIFLTKPKVKEQVK